MKAKVKNTAVLVLALVVGYVGGSILGLPPTTGLHSEGDVAKVSKFHKSSVESSISAYQQKLLSDTTALNEATEATRILSNKLSQFYELSGLSMMVAGEIPELSEEVAALKSVYGLSENAMHAGEVASASLGKLQSGEDNELAIDVEQASQNLTLAYMSIDHQVGLGKDFVTAADNYLSKNKYDEDLAAVRDLWAVFCAENAVIDGNAAEMAYWGKQKILSSDLGASAILVQGIDDLKTSIDELKGIIVLSASIDEIKGMGVLTASIDELKAKIDIISATIDELSGTEKALQSEERLNSSESKVGIR